jgi:hypothetical protein
VVDEKRKLEIRFLVKNKEWTTEIETLFWISIRKRRVHQIQDHGTCEKEA